MKQLPSADQEWLWQEMAHAVRQAEPLPKALRALSQAHAGTRRGEAAARLAEALADGASLPRAVADQGERFAPGVAPALAAAERGGKLAEILQSLSDSARADGALRFSIVQAILYPTIVAVAGLLAMLFIEVRIRPECEALWKELDIDVPVVVRVAPYVLQTESVLALLLPAGVLALLYLVPPGSLPRRQNLDLLRMKLPLVGAAVRRALLARWCATMGVLVQAGLPEPQAVRFAGESTGNLGVIGTSNRLAEQLDRGVKLSEALEEREVVESRGFFTPQLTWMVQASESAGGHAHVWPVAHDLYRDLANRSAYAASMVLRVLFIILAIQIVAMTASSLIHPLVRLMQSLGG